MRCGVCNSVNGCEHVVAKEVFEIDRPKLEKIQDAPQKYIPGVRSTETSTGSGSAKVVVREGARGEKGEKGDRGATGEPGSAGPIGPQGPPGGRGFKREPGVSNIPSPP